MKKQTFVYIIVGSGAVLILYLLNQNKKLTEKSEAFFCDKNTHIYDYTEKKCLTYEEQAKIFKNKQTKASNKL